MSDLIMKDIDLKMDEAKYFFKKMIDKEEQQNSKVFSYYLSVFTSASRSILQYVCKYYNEFYNSTIYRVELKDYFQKLRNKNIHDRIINLNTSGSNGILSEITVEGKSDCLSVEKPTPRLDIVNKYYYSEGGATESIVEFAFKYIEEIHVV